jgi:hypothetical protein
MTEDEVRVFENLKRNELLLFKLMNQANKRRLKGRFVDYNINFNEASMKECVEHTPVSFLNQSTGKPFLHLIFKTRTAINKIVAMFHKIKVILGIVEGQLIEDYVDRTFRLQTKRKFNHEWVLQRLKYRNNLDQIRCTVVLHGRICVQPASHQKLTEAEAFEKLQTPNLHKMI